MRLLLAVIAATPVAVGVAVLVLLAAAGPYLAPDVRLALVAVAPACLALAAGGVIVTAWTRWRMRGLIRRAERLATPVAAADGGVPEEPEVVRHLADVPAGPAGRLDASLERIEGILEATRRAATVDRLTGVPSRSSLIATVFAEVDRAVRYERPLSIAFVDIDLFKQVNDTHGHAIGDVVLRGVAQALRANLRATDTIGRYGGEEFLLVLTETSPDDAAVLAEKLREIVGRLRFPVPNHQDLSITISIGIAGGRGRALRVEPLMHHADSAMYTAKSLGRNQTFVFAEPNDDASVPRAPISPAGRLRAVALGREAREAAVRRLADAVAGVGGEDDASRQRVTEVATAIGTHLGLPEVEVDRLRLAAQLHDIGKVVVPTEILDKPGPLTQTEWRTVVQHPRIAEVILDQVASVRDAAAIILHHHERFGGHGYPHGLRGTEIPIGARILAIAEAYDAMTRPRPYRGAMRHAQAVQELRRHAGTQFDPELVEAFCDLYTTAPSVPGGPDPAGEPDAPRGARRPRPPRRSAGAS